MESNNKNNNSIIPMEIIEHNNSAPTTTINNGNNNNYNSEILNEFKNNLLNEMKSNLSKELNSLKNNSSNNNNINDNTLTIITNQLLLFQQKHIELLNQKYENLIESKFKQLEDKVLDTLDDKLVNNSGSINGTAFTVLASSLSKFKRKLILNNEIDREELSKRLAVMIDREFPQELKIKDNELLEIDSRILKVKEMLNTMSRQRPRKNILELPYSSSLSSTPATKKNVYMRLQSGQYVQLICPSCKKSEFSTIIGFLNHCRIKHNRKFSSQEEAAEAIGVPVSEDKVPLDDPSRPTAPVYKFKKDSNKINSSLSSISSTSTNNSINSSSNNNNNSGTTNNNSNNKDIEVKEKQEGKNLSDDLMNLISKSSISSENILNNSTSAIASVSTSTSTTSIATTSNNDNETSTNMEMEEESSSRFYIKKRIIVGNTCTQIHPDHRGQDKSTHKWMVYVRGPQNEPDISYFVKRIWFYLHDSFAPNDRVEITEKPFQLVRRGWGEFPIRVKLFFHDTRNKPIDIIHNLKLIQTPIQYGVTSLCGETTTDLELDRLFFEKRERQIQKQQQLQLQQQQQQKSQIDNSNISGIIVSSSILNSNNNNDNSNNSGNNNDDSVSITTTTTSTSRASTSSTTNTTASTPTTSSSSSPVLKSLSSPIVKKTPSKLNPPMPSGRLMKNLASISKELRIKKEMEKKHLIEIRKELEKKTIVDVTIESESKDSSNSNNNSNSSSKVNNNNRLFKFDFDDDDLMQHPDYVNKKKQNNSTSASNLASTTTTTSISPKKKEEKEKIEKETNEFESITKVLFKLAEDYPIISEIPTLKKLPYKYSKTRDDWIRWTFGKQKSTEYRRAKIISNLFKKETNQDLTVSDTMKWCRDNGFTPLTHTQEKFYNMKDPFSDSKYEVIEIKEKKKKIKSKEKENDQNEKIQIKQELNNIFDTFKEDNSDSNNSGINNSVLENQSTESSTSISATITSNENKSLFDNDITASLLNDEIDKVLNSIDSHIDNTTTVNNNDTIINDNSNNNNNDLNNISINNNNTDINNSSSDINSSDLKTNNNNNNNNVKMVNSDNMFDIENHFLSSQNFSDNSTTPHHHQHHDIMAPMESIRSGLSSVIEEHHLFSTSHPLIDGFITGKNDMSDHNGLIGNTLSSATTSSDTTVITNTSTEPTIQETTSASTVLDSNSNMDIDMEMNIDTNTSNVSTIPALDSNSSGFTESSTITTSVDSTNDLSSVSETISSNIDIPMEIDQKPSQLQPQEVQTVLPPQLSHQELEKSNSLETSSSNQIIETNLPTNVAPPILSPLTPSIQLPIPIPVQIPVDLPLSNKGKNTESESESSSTPLPKIKKKYYKTKKERAAEAAAAAAAAAEAVAALNSDNSNNGNNNDTSDNNHSTNTVSEDEFYDFPLIETSLCPLTPNKAGKTTFVDINGISTNIINNSTKFNTLSTTVAKKPTYPSFFCRYCGTGHSAEHYENKQKACSLQFKVDSYTHITNSYPQIVISYPPNFDPDLKLKTPNSLSPIKVLKKFTYSEEFYPIDWIQHVLRIINIPRLKDSTCDFGAEELIYMSSILFIRNLVGEAYESYLEEKEKESKDECIVKLMVPAHVHSAIKKNKLFNFISNIGLFNTK